MTTVSALQQRWRTNVAPLLPEPDATWHQLASLYSEPHRHYHTLNHGWIHTDTWPQTHSAWNWPCGPTM